MNETEFNVRELTIKVIENHINEKSSWGGNTNKRNIVFVDRGDLFLKLT
jgi:hypothetical protein